MYNLSKKQVAVEASEIMEKTTKAPNFHGWINDLGTKRNNTTTICKGFPLIQ